jgi:high-affinity K+ transport system ATPase subunit B
MRVMVLSGDNVAAARALAERAGIAAADVTAGVGPAGKMEFIKQLRRSGAVRSFEPTRTGNSDVDSGTDPDPNIHRLEESVN